MNKKFISITQHPIPLFLTSRSSVVMDSRRRAPVIITHGRTTPAPAFRRSPSCSSKADSVDSDKSLEDSHSSPKMPCVVVTVPRRRFIRRHETSGNGQAVAAGRGHAAYRDFVLYPSTYHAGRDSCLGARDSSRSEHRSNTDLGELSSSESATSGETDTSSSPRRQQVATERQPLEPRLARLPTPDIPDVDESYWWAK